MRGDPQGSDYSQIATCISKLKFTSDHFEFQNVGLNRLFQTRQVIYLRPLQYFILKGGRRFEKHYGTEAPALSPK